jgi:hypothetical protein
MFGNEITLTGFRTCSIAWVHLLTPLELAWPYPFGADKIEWVSPDFFHESCIVKQLRTKMSIVHDPVGTPIEVYLRLVAGDNSVHHFKVSTHTLNKDYRLSIPEKFSALPIYFGRHPEGGYLILNMPLVRQWEAHPGPVDLPERVWPLSRFLDSPL